MDENFLNLQLEADERTVGKENFTDYTMRVTFAADTNKVVRTYIDRDRDDRPFIDVTRGMTANDARVVAAMLAKLAAAIAYEPEEFAKGQGVAVRSSHMTRNLAKNKRVADL